PAEGPRLHRPAVGPHARQPDLQGPPRRRRVPGPGGLHGARHHRPDAAGHRPAVRRAQAHPVLRVRDVRLRRADRHRGGLLRARRAADRGVPPEPADRRAGARPAAGHGAGPGHGRRQEDRVARAARDRLGRHGQLARPHPRDHGHLDGGAHPSLQARHRGLPGPGRAGHAGHRAPARRDARAPRVRRRHAALPGALPRPVVQQPPGGLAHVRGRPARRRRGRRGGDRPGDGRGGPLMTTHTQAPYEPYEGAKLARLEEDAAAILARYPEHPRSGLLPLLHLVQSEDGYVSPDGIAFCARLLGLTTAEDSAVATFYTQFKRHPNVTYTVGVCTNTLCAIMGGDAIFDELAEHLGVGHDETTPDGAITLERIECNAACDYAPVVMVNWEFFDNQTPESATALADKLILGEDVVPTRGAASVCSFKQMSRVLAGFPDG